LSHRSKWCREEFFRVLPEYVKMRVRRTFLTVPFLALILIGVNSCADPTPSLPEEVDGGEELPYLAPFQLRPEVSGLHGAVVAGHPLAAAAGYEVLRSGGTAADAAVTMAAVLAVVRPHMNGIGGDAFALFYEAESGVVTALDGSGRSARGATAEFFAERQLENMPGSGPLSVTVPGAVSAWHATLERYGTLSMAEALAPAILLAEEGFVVTHTLAEDLEAARRLNEAGQAIYAPGGEPHRAGAVLRNPSLARSLRALSDQGPEAVYGGAIGEALVRFLEAEGSPLRLEDFAAHTAEWTEPASLEFMGRNVYTLPPSSQGMVLLQTLAIAEAYGLGSKGTLTEARGPLDPNLIHTMVEAKKLAFADRDRWVADRSQSPAPMDRLLDREYLSDRASKIGSLAAMDVEPGFGEPITGDDPAAGDGDTVYLIAVDADGNAVSWVQSLFSSFGSRLVDPETGIVLHNRGGGFTLIPGHPNEIAGGKRPFHTLMATLVTSSSGSFEIALGTPGGHGQSQTVAQSLVQMLVLDMAPQHSSEAPRFRSYNGVRLDVEDRISQSVRVALEEMGHELRLVGGWDTDSGNLLVVRRESNGVLRTGADMRREGAAMAW